MKGMLSAVGPVHAAVHWREAHRRGNLFNSGRFELHKLEEEHDENEDDVPNRMNLSDLYSASLEVADDQSKDEKQRMQKQQVKERPGPLWTERIWAMLRAFTPRCSR